MALEKLQFRPELFLNQSIAIYGPSKSGRTAIAMEIFHTLSDHIYAAYSFSADGAPALYEPTIFRKEISDEAISEITHNSKVPNQHVLVIMDDTYAIKKDILMDAMNSFSNKDLNITQILVSHDDRGIPYNIKNNIDVHIFTNKYIAQTYFQRHSNGFTLNQIDIANKHILNTTKLAYFKQTDTFMYL